MRLEHAVDAFLDHLRVERGLATRTVTAYGRDLSKLVDFAESQGRTAVGEADLALVTRWIGTLAEAGLGARSTARHLSAARGLFKFLVREGELDADPSSLVARPKIGRKLPKPLGARDLAMLLSTPDTRRLRGLRDRAVLSLGYAAGLRASEIVGLRLGDLDLGRGVVAAFGKGGKRRLVPLGEVALDHLEAYLEARREAAEQQPTRRPASEARDAYVFPSPRGGMLTRQALYKIVRRNARAAGLAGRVHPHQLRHSFATHMLNGGADLRAVQAMLGHSSITTTEVYTQVSKDHLRDVHRRSHPRS